MEGAGQEGDQQPAQSAAPAVDLLSVDDAAAQARWQQLGEQELQDEIARYRTSLQSLAQDLASAAAAPGGQTGDRAGDGVNGGGGGAASGEEEVQMGSVDDLHPSEWQVPPHCVPIHANVTTYDWSRLAAAAQFDVIMMDPPWALATANPTRGVALGYSQLTDTDIMGLPIPSLQTAGLLFVWVINAKYKFTLDLFERWGYTVIDEIVWVKMTVNRRLAKSHGYYLQHAKEVCLVGRKGGDPPGLRGGVGNDVIYSERRGQSQKPEEIYQLIEQLVPNGKYLEIFGRKNNLRNHWVTLGNEVTGTGLPPEDLANEIAVANEIGALKVPPGSDARRKQSGK